MNVLDKINPYLTSEDDVARWFALEAVSTYPEAKPEWPVREMEEFSYGYFTIMGHDHRELDDWREKMLEDREQSGDISSLPLDLVDPAPRTPVVSEKIGRNEPCTCSSGKRYKKCHGK